MGIHLIKQDRILIKEAFLSLPALWLRRVGCSSFLLHPDYHSLRPTSEDQRMLSLRRIPEGSRGCIVRHVSFKPWMRWRRWTNDVHSTWEIFPNLDSNPMQPERHFHSPYSKGSRAWHDKLMSLEEIWIQEKRWSMQPCARLGKKLAFRFWQYSNPLRWILS